MTIFGASEYPWAGSDRGAHSVYFHFVGRIRSIACGIWRKGSVRLAPVCVAQTRTKHFELLSVRHVVVTAKKWCERGRTLLMLV